MVIAADSPCQFEMVGTAVNSQETQFAYGTVREKLDCCSSDGVSWSVLMFASGAEECSWCQEIGLNLQFLWCHLSLVNGENAKAEIRIDLMLQ